MVGPRVLHTDMPAGDGARDQIRTALDSIGQHIVGRAAQPLHTLDDDLVGARALDLGAHGAQKIGEIHDFRLARRVLQHRLAFGQHRGHHQVLRAGYGDGLQHQPCPFEALGARLDVAVFDVNVGTHGLQAGDVNIDRAGPDGAPAGQGYVRGPKAREQGAEHQNRCAHGLHELIGSKVFPDRRRIDFNAHFLVDGHPDAHAAEQLDHGGDVVKVWHVGDGHRTVGQQTGSQYRQSGIFGAGNADFAFERYAALNLQFIHVGSTIGQSRMLFGCKDLQSERVNLVAHRAPERRVHQLVPLERPLADERRGDYDRLEMHIIPARDRRAAARQAALNQLDYLLWVHALSLVVSFTDGLLLHGFKPHRSRPPGACLRDRRFARSGAPLRVGVCTRLPDLSYLPWTNSRDGHG